MNAAILIQEPKGACVDIDGSHRGRVCCCHAEHFTETEIKVLCLLADGLSNSEIASHLSVSGHTVDRHVTQMLRRSRTRNRAGLVSAAFRAGVLVVDSNMLRPSGRRCLLLADSAAPG